MDPSWALFAVLLLVVSVICYLWGYDDGKRDGYKKGFDEGKLAGLDVGEERVMQRLDHALREGLI